MDALIVQDFGVLRLLKEWCPEMRIHASTQMSVHTVKGAMLLKELGVKRVVLARELSREQIREIAERTGLETEVFVHGALCMSVSGQCYLSAMIGGRSGNKGSCAGTCRLPFTSVKGRERYDLSLKDNCLAERFGELEDLGVASLKIEGRMKRPEYVAAATAAYAALRDGRQPDLSLLRAVFSRSGFTDGYFTGKTGTEMFGVRQKEDVLSATGEVLRSLRGTYRKEKPCRPVSMQFILKKEISAKLIAKCGGCSVEVSGEVPQAALNRPITEITARESFSKLVGTVYFLETLSCEIEEGLILPKSALNELRRAVVEKLNLLCGSPEPVPFLERDISLPSEHQPSGKSLRARFEHASQIPEQVWEEAELIYLPVGEVLRHTETLLPYSGKIILEPDRLMAGTEERTVSQCGVLAGKGFRRLAVSNPAHLQIGKDLGMALHGTAFLNCTNSFSALQYQELGLSDLILSFENTAKRMDRIKGSLPSVSYTHLAVFPVSAGESIQLGTYHVTALDACHDESEQALIYAVRQGGRELLYATDLCRLEAASWEILKGFSFDYVILDQTYGPGTTGGGHLNADQVVEIIAEMRSQGILKPNGESYATHLSHEGNPPHNELARFAASRGYQIAYDGLVLETEE